MSSSSVLGPGRTASVTGASRGIGPLIARAIAHEGGHVVLTGRSVTRAAGGPRRNWPRRAPMSPSCPPT